MSEASANIIRNIAIIAHVDHGKTTLVDSLLKQSNSLQRKMAWKERIMDSNDQERERGITILAKNTAIDWNGFRINIVDTPGHADFGGEVERVLSMVDSVLLLVDAIDGPMPQTRFVTQKAFSYNLRPIVVINKIDRDGSRPHWVIDQVFELFVKLGASDAQLDFPIVYTSALKGQAGFEIDSIAPDLTPLFETIIQKAPPPESSINAPLQMQISALDYSNFVGIIGLGRIKNGKITTNQSVTVVSQDGSKKNGRILQILGFRGLEKVEQPEALAGDIVSVSGIEKLTIGDTICDPQNPLPLPPLTVDHPTLRMKFCVNDSPLAGREGKYLTSRQLAERLEKELLHNVALRVEQGSSSDEFVVSGRGELHLSVLIESMRRESFELAISRPEVIIKTINGVTQEPYEQLVIDCENEHQGSIMELLGWRRAELQQITSTIGNRLRLEFSISSRGLIGFRNEFLSATSGSGIMTHIFDRYDTFNSSIDLQRKNGVLISMADGKSLAYSLFSLQERGKLFIGHGIDVYEGMIVGIHSRQNDIAVNPTKGKKLDNMRAAGSDENILLTPPLNYSLEQCMEFIEEDELVEVTPKSLRLRKKFLTENQRKRFSK
ncbi:MAG: translational GTPase TypA [Methylacidiphilales bacterium]|nr:translational GTPase TypA [Candidatus Methylacidiphilales bacterium]